MRMEELSESRYVKSTDTVEKYLLDIVKEYFKGNNVASESSKEYIIEKAVKRMKEELDFKNLGVLSVTLPDGVQRTGNVEISLEDLNGEPAIVPKLSAFNVDFGTINGTACEGDDPRLSDKRQPLKHQHLIKDIKNLSAELSTINGKIDRMTDHVHDNLHILDKIMYTGNKAVIDLADIEQAEDKIKAIIKEIYDDIAIYQNSINTKAAQVNDEIDILQREITDLRKYIIDKNEQYKSEVISYADTKIADTMQDVEAKLDGLVTKNMLSSAMHIAQNAYTFYDKISVSFADMLQGGNYQYKVEAAAIISGVQGMHDPVDSADVIIEVTMKTGNRTYKLPYIVMDSYGIKGMITYTLDGMNAVIITDVNGDIPAAVTNSVITVSYYIRQDITI